MNRNVPSNSARYFRAFIGPSSVATPGLGSGVTPYRVRPAPRESGARRATSGRAPRRARAGRPPGRIRPTATAPWRSSRTAGGQRLGRVGSDSAAAIRGGQLRAAGHPERQERQAGQEQRRLGQGGRIRDLAGQGQPHRGRQVGMDDRADVGPGGVDREVDRQVRGRPAAAARDGPRDPGGRARRRRGRRPSSSSLRRPVGVTSSRSASSRTERLPSPAEIRPRAPSRRPARRMASVAASASGPCTSHALRGRIVAPTPPCDAPGDPQYHRPMPASRPPSRSPSRSTSRSPRTATSRSCWSARAISALGDAVSFTALPLLVLALTGSGFAMGVVGALQTLPDLFFGMVAGAHRRPERPEADDVPGRPRSGRPDRADPAVRRSRRPDDGRHPGRRRTDGHPPLVLPGRLHRVGARRSSGGARSVEQTRIFEVIYSIGLHHRSGDRRRPGRDDRPRPDAGHRRGVVRAVRAWA